jgi:plastocyanin
MRRLPLALLAATALIGAGCGSDDDEDDAGAGAGETATEQSAPSGAAGDSGTKISMVSGNKFEPAEATVKAGDTVTWTNADSVPHNAVADKGSGPKSELLSKDQTYTFTPSAPGEITYVCTIHPGMKGTLTVQ